jgi:hypothetical protein
MGLSITVGALADLLEEDPEGAVMLRSELEVVNFALRDSWVGEHVEPQSIQVWSADGYGYSGLHALREVAGLVWLGQDIPCDEILDGQQGHAEQALSDAYVQYLEPQQQIGWLGRILGRSPQERRSPPFTHLVMHSDAAGFYVPLDFPDPVMPLKMDGESDHIWPVGSVQRLQLELTELAQVLGLPDGLKHDDEELEQCLEEQAPAKEGPLWKIQPIATHSLLLLREACAHSLTTGAAISFE